MQFLIFKMEGFEQMLALGDSKEDLVLKDFVTKRSALLNELLRGLSHKCISTCSKFAAISNDEDDSSKIPDFTI
jgi:hypothetical protein